MLVKLNKNLILEDADVKNTDKDKEDELYRKKALEIGLTSADPKMDRRQIDREHELFTKANDLRNEQNRLNKDNMKLNPEQVQVFTPTPSTYSTLMYYTEMDPWTREKIFVEKDPIKKQKQKDLIVSKIPIKISKKAPDIGM